MPIEKPCFFMICTDRTKQECLDRELFGDKEWVMRYLGIIKKGDVGFLLNITRNQILGLFIAEGQAQLNIEPDAWNGNFPAQIPVKLVGELLIKQEANENLEKIFPLKDLQVPNRSYRVPSKRTYGPDVTQKIITLFDFRIDIERQKDSSEVGEYSEHTFSDVAGLSKVKAFIKRRIIDPFDDEEIAYSLGLRVGGGILLFGPPGTGKTLIAKAISRDIQAKFIDISPSIIAGYPGDAEKHLEKTFDIIEKEPRAVIFFDEGEWVLGKRSNLTSSVMQRVVPLLLMRISRLLDDRKRPVIIIAATNVPDQIDSAFLRSGRFGHQFYVGLPNEEEISDILRIHLRARKNALDDENISELSHLLEGYSGADIELIIDEAAHLAFESRNNREETKISKENVLGVMAVVRKSVTKNEIEKIKAWAKKNNIETD